MNTVSRLLTSISICAALSGSAFAQSRTTELHRTAPSADASRNRVAPLKRKAPSAANAVDRAKPVATKPLIERHAATPVKTEAVKASRAPVTYDAKAARPSAKSARSFSAPEAPKTK
jgi:hypothetical protein